MPLFESLLCAGRLLQSGRHNVVVPTETLFYHVAHVTVHSSYDAFKNLGCSRVHQTTPLQLARCCGVLSYHNILCIDGTNGAVLEHDFENRNIVPAV